jgi:hypothetical protein
VSPEAGENGGGADDNGGGQADVTRAGLEGARPGRESRTWSGTDGRSRQDREPGEDHPGESYYGKPIINPPVWEELEIAGYLFTGGLSGASAILAAGADLTGRPALARGARLMATGAIMVSLGALVKDLGRPQRFLNMLRVFKPTSPMSVGVWILVGYAPLTAAAAASEVFGRAPRTGRAAGLAAALLGSGVSTYTGALISNTAVPAWHEGRREMPILFAGSAASAAAGWGLVVAPSAESEPARRLAILGALVELGAGQALSRRLGMISEALDEGKAGKRMKIAKGLTAAGTIGAAALGAAVPERARRPLAIASGAALLAGSAFTRFGIFAGGMASARDPKYTVEPQRARLDANRRATV